MRFEWDPSKAATNVRKHGVSFIEAAECFEDPLALVLDEPGDPDRLILIGESRKRRLVFTVYAERHTGTIRIISARLATRRERRRYEEDED
ncbi:MAG: BrnT family toxin [Acidobacteriota bacterium]